jgi:excisionase family DNA binding protein
VIINKLEQLQATLDIISVNNPRQKQAEPPPDPNRIIDLPEAAKILRKPVGTVRGYIHSRNLPATLVGKSYLIKCSELMQWFENFQNDTLPVNTTTAPAKMLENRKRYRKD